MNSCGTFVFSGVIHTEMNAIAGLLAVISKNILIRSENKNHRKMENEEENKILDWDSTFRTD